MKLWLLAASVCLLGIVAQAELVTEDSFETIKNTPAEQMVLFYRSSDPDSSRVVKMMEKVAKKIKKELPRFGFRKCDGDLPINEKDFKEAAFHKGSFIFTSTPIEGIVKYTGPVDAKSLAQHIRHKYLKYDAEDVATFQDEDSLYEKLDTENKPVFVKFYESWCEHCKRLKEPFAIGATYFKDRVQFMEVECSKNEDTTSFCTRNEVRSYPVLMLFTGEDKVQFKEEMRSIMTFEKFFDEHLGKGGSGGKSSESGDDEEEEVVTKKSKRSSKKSSSSDEGDDEKLASKLSKGNDKAAKNEEDLAELGSFAKPKASDGKSLEDRVAALEATVRELQDKLRDK